jgi:hypothetical protein
VALHTPELWSDTHVTLTLYGRQHIYFHERWILRSRLLPVTRLSIDFDDSYHSTELAHRLAEYLVAHSSQVVQSLPNL